MLAESTGGDVIWYYYDSDGVRAAMEYEGDSYYYVYNLQGDVLGLVDEIGEVVVEYTYDSWGNILSVTGSMASTLGVDNPFRYRGYYYDEESGLYYLNSRYYDPVTRRFVNADGYISTGQGVLGSNMFAYCLNNPVMYIDLFGNCPIGFIGPCPGITRCKYFINLQFESGESNQNQAEEFTPPETFSEVVDAVLDSFTFDAGVGGGFLGEAEVGVAGASLGFKGDFLHIRFSEGEWDLGDETVAGVGLSVPGINWDSGVGIPDGNYFHSFSCSCRNGGTTCDRLEYYSPGISHKIEIGAQLYLGYGGCISGGFDIDYFCKRMGWA